jgi:uncharacterized membrane protein YphA (DoxX/SURF4 family)
MRIVTQIARFLVGGLFIFSGFIKANDPLGFSYKLQEYFAHFKADFLIPASLSLAILICVFEIVLGFAIWLGARRNLSLWLSMLMMLFFTFLTFYSAYRNVVTDCGCFGDFLHLTPWTSFIKDVVILILLIILIFGRHHINPLTGQRAENFLLGLIIAASVAFPIYTYSYLPVFDFREYAIGSNIAAKTVGVPDELKYFYRLKDKSTGKVTEFDHWPANWDQKYDYVDNRTEVTKKGKAAKIMDFRISSYDGSDYTQDILNIPQPNFLLVCYDLEKTDLDVFGKINDFATLCEREGVSFVGLTASTSEQLEEFRADSGAKFRFFNMDGTVLKTMIRSNPGLMMLEGGTVKAMWHHNSFPSFNDVKSQYFKGNK